jgi:hypothetical protein
MHRDGAVASLTRVASSCGLARCCVGAHIGVAEKHGDNYASDYLIDLIANKTVAFLDGWAARAGGGDGGEEAGTGRPFFAVAAVPAAHEPADPAPQYADYATGLKAGGGSTDGGGGARGHARRERTTARPANRRNRRWDARGRIPTTSLPHETATGLSWRTVERCGGAARKDTPPCRTTQRNCDRALLEAPRTPTYNVPYTDDARHWMIANANWAGVPMNQTVRGFDVCVLMGRTRQRGFGLGVEPAGEGTAEVDVPSRA